MFSSFRFFFLSDHSPLFNFLTVIGVHCSWPRSIFFVIFPREIYYTCTAQVIVLSEWEKNNWKSQVCRPLYRGFKSKKSQSIFYFSIFFARNKRILDTIDILLIASNSSYAGTTRTVIIAEDHRTVTRGIVFVGKAKSYLAYHGTFMKMFCCVYIGFEQSRIIYDVFTLYLTFSGYAEIKVCIAKYSFVIKRYTL